MVEMAKDAQIWISPDWNVNKEILERKEYVNGHLNITRLECK